MMSREPFYVNASTLPEFTYDQQVMELPVGSQVVLITLYGGSTLLSVCGNIVVIVVLCLGNRSRTDLRPFLINLALSDLCMACFCMPFSFTIAMLGRWVFGTIACPLVKFMQVTSVAVSIYTNVAIGIDRYWAVRFPLRQRVTRNRSLVVLTVIWTISILTGTAQLVVTRAEERSMGSFSVWECGERWGDPRERAAYTLVLVLAVYVLPLGALAYTYCHVARALWVQPVPGNEHAQRDKLFLRAKIKITRMLVALVVAFAVCWLPLHAFNVVLDVAPHLIDQIQTLYDERLFLGIYLSCLWLAMANSFINPFIFGFLNESFKADLRYLCRRCVCRRVWHQAAQYTIRPLKTRTSRSRTPSSTRPLAVSRRLGGHYLRHPNGSLLQPLARGTKTKQLTDTTKSQRSNRFACTKLVTKPIREA